VAPSQARTSNPECRSRHNTILGRRADRRLLASPQTCHDHHESTLQPTPGDTHPAQRDGHHNLAAAVGECLGRSLAAAATLSVDAIQDLKTPQVGDGRPYPADKAVAAAKPRQRPTWR
jgi:hypothetical protein